MAGGSNGYRAALARHRLTPVLISSLPGRAGLTLFISFLTSCETRSNENLNLKPTKGAWPW